MRRTEFGLIKFQNPQVWSSYNYLFVMTWKSLLRKVLHVTILLGQLILLTFRSIRKIRTFDCQTSLSLMSWTQIIFQSCLPFWILLERGKPQTELKSSRAVIGFKLRSQLMSPSIHISYSEETDKGARDFAVSIAFVHTIDYKSNNFSWEIWTTRVRSSIEAQN